MTDSVAHAAKSQSMVDAITQSAKTDGRSQKTNFKGTRQTQESDDNENQNGENDVKARRSDHATSRTSVDKSDKSSKKSDREDHDKNDDGDKSFEATIDKLGDKAQTATTTQNGMVTPLPTGWAAEFTLRHTNGELKRGDESVSPTSGNAKSVALPGKLLKQDSIVALLDAKQRLLSAQDSKDAPPDGNTDNTNDATPVAMTVQSRESHWVFDSSASTANPRVFASLMENGGKTDHGAAATVATAAAAKGGEKAQASPSSQVQTSTVVASGDATPRQAFDGQQQSTGNNRDQMPSDNPGEGRATDVKSSAPLEHASLDVSDLPGSVSGATQQVRNGIVDALNGDGRGAAAVNGPSLPQDRPVVPTQVLRTIDLTLSPPDLGTVRLKLSLISNALDIDAQASKASTAKLLDDDRKGLEQSLRDAGYDVKSLKIAESSAAGNASLNSSLNGGSSFQDGSQARANLSGRQDGNMPRRDGTMSDQQSQQRSPRDDGRRASQTNDAANGRHANAIYI